MFVLGKAEEPLTVRYTYLIWPTPLNVCVAVTYAQTCSRVQMQRPTATLFPYTHQHLTTLNYITYLIFHIC